jgi:DNA mismatch repair ATPase MutS
MDDEEKQDVQALLSRLERTRVESERRLHQLTIDNRLATEAEISEALGLTDSLAALDTQIERLRQQLKLNRDDSLGVGTKTEHEQH